MAGAGIADLITDATRAIFLESPGSLTFEVQDVPAITAIARDRGIATLIDNTWATPRSEEHTSELQSLMRISYAVFCLKKKKTTYQLTHKSYQNLTNSSTASHLIIETTKHTQRQ